MKIDIILNEFTTVKEAAELAKYAEKHGVDAIWSTSYAGYRDPYMLLTHAATVTERIKLGPCAICPWELHPVKMIMAHDTLNDLCNGRAQTMVGGGGGVLYFMGGKPERRVTVVRETVEILNKCRPGEFYFHEGEIYAGVKLPLPEWVRPEPRRVLVGANGPKMIKMATQLGAGLMMSDCTVDMLEGQMNRIRAGLSDAGRSLSDFTVNNFWAWHVYKDKDEAIREARRELVWRGALIEDWLRPYLEEEDVQLVRQNFDNFRYAWIGRTHEIEGVPEHIIETLTENLAFVGDYSDVPRFIERMKKFEALGLTNLALRMHDNQEESVRLICEAIVPHFRS